ncbi:hypothetical protein FOZ63_028817, partial [Perkinsus olseni]
MPKRLHVLAYMQFDLYRSFRVFRGQYVEEWAFKSSTRVSEASRYVEEWTFIVVPGSLRPVCRRVGLYSSTRVSEASQYVEEWAFIVVSGSLRPVCRRVGLCGRTWISDASEMAPCLDAGLDALDSLCEVYHRPRKVD